MRNVGNKTFESIMQGTYRNNIMPENVNVTVPIWSIHLMIKSNCMSKLMNDDAFIPTKVSQGKVLRGFTCTPDR